MVSCVIDAGIVAWKRARRDWRGLFLRARGSDGVRWGRGEIDQSRRGHRGD